MILDDIMLKITYSILESRVLVYTYIRIMYRDLLRCIHHFKSDLVYNMDHMRISGIEPSSVILSQRKKLKRLKNNVPKVPKEAKTKRDGVINPQN